jgi:hypothetical protein
VAGRHALVLAGVPGERHGELVDLEHRHGVPPPEGLRGQREELDPLPFTVSGSGDHLAAVGLGRSMARGGCGPGHRGVLKGMGDRDVQSRVLASGPVGDEDVRWPPVPPGEQEAALPGGAQGRADRRLGKNSNSGCTMFASNLFGLMSFQHQTATVTVNATELHIHAVVTLIGAVSLFDTI